MIIPALQYFREVAACGSIRRAAERLSIAPSAISRQVTNLEAELGTSLLDRRSKRLALTPAGERVLAHVERAVQDLGNLRADLQELSGARTGQVRVASIEGMVTYFLARYLASFEQRSPGVTVSISVLGSRAVLEALGAGQADLALAFNLPARHPFREHARLEQPVCAIVAPTHALAGRRSVSFAELAGQRVALPDRSFQVRHLVERYALKAKVALEIVAETNSLEMAKGFVRSSQLLTFLPRYAALDEIANSELCAVPLQERDFAGTSVSLVTARDHRLSLAARNLLETLKSGMACYTPGLPAT